MGLQNIETEEEPTKAEKAQDDDQQSTLPSRISRDGDHDLVRDSRWKEAEFLEDTNNFGERVAGLPPDTRRADEYDPSFLLGWEHGWYDATGLIKEADSGAGKVVGCRCGKNMGAGSKQRAVMCSDCRSVLIDPQWFKRDGSLVGVSDHHFPQNWGLYASHVEQYYYRVINWGQNRTVVLSDLGGVWLATAYDDVAEKGEHKNPYHDSFVEQNVMDEIQDKTEIPLHVVEGTNELIEQAFTE